MFDDSAKKKEYKTCEKNNKYNPAISFIEEEIAKNKKENCNNDNLQNITNNINEKEK